MPDGFYGFLIVFLIAFNKGVYMYKKYIMVAIGIIMLVLDYISASKEYSNYIAAYGDR